MKFNSIVIKLGATIMVLFLVILLPFGYLIDYGFLQVYSSQVYEDTYQVSEDVVRTFDDLSNFESEFYKKLKRISRKDIIVFNEDGIVTSPTIYEYTKGKPISEDLLRTLKEGKTINREYTNPETGEHLFFVGRPIMKDGTFQGGILVFSSITEIHQFMHDIRYWTIGSIIISIILALGYTIFISKKLSNPLIEMEKATREIAKGNLTTRVQIHSKDEMGSLAQAINDLSIELNNYRVNRSELLANISHELRTPISYLKGYAQLINRHQYRNNEELEAYAEVIEKESDRFAKLIHELYVLSKMEDDQLPLYLQAIDIEDLIESTVQKVKLKAKKKDLDLFFEIENNLPPIITDGSKLVQILLNLLENAIHYTEQGHITVTATSEKESIIISVKDSGVGIPSEDLPFIFDRFHRVEKSRSREKGGTGLGLAIVSELVKQLKGSITVQSELGNGSDFILSLPKRIEEK